MGREGDVEEYSVAVGDAGRPQDVGVDGGAQRNKGWPVMPGGTLGRAEVPRGGHRASWSSRVKPWGDHQGHGGANSPVPLQEEMQTWLQGLHMAITSCQNLPAKARSLPTPHAPPEPRRDKEKRFSFFPKKK